jgi:hypothetical protein
MLKYVEPADVTPNLLKWRNHISGEILQTLWS